MIAVLVFQHRKNRKPVSGSKMPLSYQWGKSVHTVQANKLFTRGGFLTRMLAAVTLLLGLSACGGSEWGFPYRITVQQGNWITAEQVAQLEAGMSREQVRYILGSPTLQDAFHAERWDYPFYNQPGYGTDELRKFTVWFEHDQLVRWEGSQQPDRQPFEKADSGSIATAVEQEAQADTDAEIATSPDLGEVVDTEVQAIEPLDPIIEEGITE